MRPIRRLVRLLFWMAPIVLAPLAPETATAQVVVYRPVVTMFAPAAGPSVANYMPSGNYAAVTAFSPPVVESVALPATAAPVATAVAIPAVPVTAYHAPVYVAPTYAAPAAVATTTFYAPAAAPIVAAPVTTYYAPAAVAVPLYRRGLFGGYRPVRAAYYPYY